MLATDSTLEIQLFIDGNTRNASSGGAQYAVLEAYFQLGRVAMTMPLNASCTSAVDAPCDWNAAVTTGPNGKLLNATCYELSSIWASEAEVLAM